MTENEQDARRTTQLPSADTWPRGEWREVKETTDGEPVVLYPMPNISEPCPVCNGDASAISYRKYDGEKLPDLNPACTVWVVSNPRSTRKPAGSLAIISHKGEDDAE